MMFVDSLHINRWLCGDNVQHIVPTMMHPHTHTYTHTHTSGVACVVVFLLVFFLFLILKQSEGHLLISLFQKKKNTKAFQVYEQGFLNRCHLASTQCVAAMTKQKTVLFCCHCCRKVHNKRLHLSAPHPPAPILPDILPFSYHGSISPI